MRESNINKSDEFVPSRAEAETPERQRIWWKSLKPLMDVRVRPFGEMIEYRARHGKLKQSDIHIQLCITDNEPRSRPA